MLFRSSINHGYNPGDWVADTGNTGFNGLTWIVASTPSADTFTVTDLFGNIISEATASTGGSVALDVPAGTQRTFQILGVVTSTGVCPSTFAELESAMGSSILTQIISGVTGTDALQAEAPVVLASSTVDVTADASVTLTPSYTALSAKPVFCDGIGAPAIVDASVTSVAASSAATGALDAVVHLRLNKAVTGFAEIGRAHV